MDDGRRSTREEGGGGMKWSFKQDLSQESRLYTKYRINAAHAPMTQMIAAPRRTYHISSLDAVEYEKEIAKTNLQAERPLQHLLSHALKNRRTSWTFSERDLDLSTLASWLSYSFGLSSPDEKLRTYPAGGQFYPIEIYFVPTKRSLERGLLEEALYKYNVDSDCIVKIKPVEISRLSNLTAATDVGFFSFDHAQVLVFLVANDKYMQVKYMAATYRLMLLEAGHMAQNFLLVATDLGLSSVPIGGFHEEEVNTFLGINKSRGQTAVYLLLGG